MTTQDSGDNDLFLGDFFLERVINRLPEIFMAIELEVFSEGRYTVPGLYDLVIEDISHSFIGEECEIILRAISSSVYIILRDIAQNQIYLYPKKLRKSSIYSKTIERLIEEFPGEDLRWIDEDRRLVKKFIEAKAPEKMGIFSQKCLV